jgi:hypothetical protein
VKEAVVGREKRIVVVAVVVATMERGEQPTKVFVGKDEREKRNHFIRRTTRVLCQEHTPSILTGTAQRSFFCNILGLVVRLPQLFVRRGGCANTADVRFSLTCSPQQCSALSVALGESHHEILGFS